MEENIQLSDITIVATLADTVLLCVMNEDTDNPNTLAIQYDLAMGTFMVDNIQKFLKFTPFEPVDFENKDIQNFYRDWIYRKLPNDVYVDSLIKFTGNKVPNELQKAYLSGLISDELIEKAWKKQPVGTIVTRKDGKKYRKVSETGDSTKDWIPENQKKKLEDSSLNDKKDNINSKDNKPKLTIKELKEFANNASETSLNNAIKESSSPEERKIAHEELNRRKEEEHIQEDTDENNSNDFKTSIEKNKITIKGSSGELTADIKNDNIVIFSAAINPDKRGSGEGKKMYDELIKQAKKLDKNVASYYTLSGDSLGMWNSLSKRYDVEKNPKTKIYSEEFKKRGMELPKDAQDFASTGDPDIPCFILKIKKENKKESTKIDSKDKPIKKSFESWL